MGRGNTPKTEDSIDRLLKSKRDKGRGSKNRKILRTSHTNGPKNNLIRLPRATAATAPAEAARLGRRRLDLASALPGAIGHRRRADPLGANSGQDGGGRRGLDSILWDLVLQPTPSQINTSAFCTDPFCCKRAVYVRHFEICTLIYLVLHLNSGQNLGTILHDTSKYKPGAHLQSDGSVCRQDLGSVCKSSLVACGGVVGNLLRERDGRLG